jgi:hypothetical protein
MREYAIDLNEAFERVFAELLRRKRLHGESALRRSVNGFHDPGWRAEGKPHLQVRRIAVGRKGTASLCLFGGGK